jgi:fatty acid elongase 3
MTCITYFIVIFGGRFLMTNIPAFKLQAPFMIHNVLLTLVSGILLVLMIEQAFPILYNKGVMVAFCAEETWTQPLELLYYLNYLVKYWELIDTIFLVLKKKKLGKFCHSECFCVRGFLDNLIFLYL